MFYKSWPRLLTVYEDYDDESKNLQKKKLNKQKKIVYNCHPKILRESYNYCGFAQEAVYAVYMSNKK